MTGRDHIYRDPQNQLVDFAFDEAVADVFADMIRRSVPAYETLVPLTGLLAARHLAGARLEIPDRQATTPAPVSSTVEAAVRRPAHNLSEPAARGGDSSTIGAATHHRTPPDTANPVGLVFDLGCSLGATTQALLRQMQDRPCRIVAVDKSKPMLDRAAARLDDNRVEFLLRDIRATDVSGADVILMNYVLQFLPPGERQGLMNRFRKQMAPGGLLLLSEKIDFADAGDQAFFDAAHLAYKQANGYSELEVSQKRTALENVMILDTEETHIERLRSAGFAPVRTWFRCLNWASFLAWA